MGLFGGMSQAEKDEITRCFKNIARELTSLGDRITVLEGGKPPERPSKQDEAMADILGAIADANDI